jgi:hypothetical protein
MKFNYKKIASVLAATAMLGSTLAFAGAAWSGAASDYAVVYGANSQDLAAATDLASSLTVSAVAAAGSETRLMEATGDDLNYGEDWQNIDSILDEDDLETLLADGDYEDSEGATDNEVTYTQTLTFTNGGNNAVFAADTEADNEKVDTYLKLVDGINAYTYDLKFDDPVEFTDTATDTAKEDFLLTKITILGADYSITNAEDNAGADDKLDLIEIMSGSVEATQGEYTTASYSVDGKAYSVEVVIISDDAETVKFKVNGETTEALGEGDTDKLADGTVIGVKDVMPNEGSEATGADQVTFYLGANKMILEDGQEVELNGEDIDGSDVQLGNAVANELSSIQISLAPSDDVFIGVGESWEDPVFGRFMYSLDKIVEDTETISATTSSNDGKLVLMNNADDELEIPVVDRGSTSTNVFFGEDLVGASICTLQGGVVAPVANAGNLLIANDDVIAVDNAAGTLELAEGVQILFSRYRSWIHNNQYRC